MFMLLQPKKSKLKNYESKKFCTSCKKSICKCLITNEIRYEYDPITGEILSRTVYNYIGEEQIEFPSYYDPDI